jgi:hypothetical protein
MSDQSAKTPIQVTLKEVFHNVRGGKMNFYSCRTKESHKSTHLSIA